VAISLLGLASQANTPGSHLKGETVMGMVVVLDDVRDLWILIGWFCLLLGLQQWRIHRLKRALRRRNEEVGKINPPP
jgi:hypothetical protein